MKYLITIYAICLITIPCFSQKEQNEAAFLKKASEVFTSRLEQDDIIELLSFGKAIDSLAARPYQSQDEELILRKLSLLIRDAKNEPWFNAFFGALTIQETRHFIMIEELGAVSRPPYSPSKPKRTVVELIYDIGMTHGMADEKVDGRPKLKSSYIPMMSFGFVGRFYPHSNIKKDIKTASWGVGTGVTWAQEDSVRSGYVPVKVLLFGGLQNASTFQFEADYFFNISGGKNMFGYGFLVGSNAIKVGTLFYYRKNFSMISVEVRYNLAFAFRKVRY